MVEINVKFSTVWYIVSFISSVSAGIQSDFNKMAATKNHFGDSSQSHFTTKNNTRVTAQKGGLAVLPCVVKLNSPATVSWIRRKDFQLLTVGLSTHSSDKRFLVEHTRHMGHWSLRLKSVRESDRGLYECQLSIHPTESIFVELKVVEAVAEIVGAPDLHIDEGSSMRLECRLRKATENPAFVFWYHNNKMVNYDTQQGFSVTSAIVADTTLSDEEHIFSNDSMMPLAKKPIGNRDIIHKADKLVLSGTKMQLSPYLSAPTSSILKLEIVKFHHAGNYTCAPSNARSVSITVHVLQGESPAAMQQSNYSNIESEGNNSSISGSKLPYSGASGTETIFVLTISALKVKMYYSVALECKIALLVRIIKSIILILSNSRC